MGKFQSADFGACARRFVGSARAVLPEARGEKTLSEELNRGDLSEIIAENFGANATYVEGLLSRYRSNPSLVDEAWRAYFTELLGEPSAAGDGSNASQGGNGAATAFAQDEEAQGAGAWPTGEQAAPQEAVRPAAGDATAQATQATPP